MNLPLHTFLNRSPRMPGRNFLFVPGPTAGPLMRQVVDRGLTKSGIKIIGPGDVTDDDDGESRVAQARRIRTERQLARRSLACEQFAPPRRKRIAQRLARCNLPPASRAPCRACRGDRRFGNGDPQAIELAEPLTDGE